MLLLLHLPKIKAESDTEMGYLEKLKTYSSVIPSDICNVGPKVEEIIRFLQKDYGQIAEDSVFEVRVILNELIVNAVKHGNLEDCSKLVKINVSIKEDGYAQFLLEDEGKGYNHSCLFKANECVREQPEVYGLEETGRGMLIVTSLCDKVKFNGKGNKITVLKKLERA